MAYFLIALAVLIYAVYPSAMLQFVTGKIDIFSYLLVFHVVASTARISMAIFYRNAVIAPYYSSNLRLFDRRIVNNRTLKIGVANAVFDILGFGSFFYALFFGSAVQATVFYELWASVFLLLTMFWRRGQLGQFEHRHGVLNSTVFFVLGVVGVFLVVTSHKADGAESLMTLSLDDAGVNLAAIAAPILMAISFFVGTRNARIISLHLQEAFAADKGIDAEISQKRADVLAGIYHGVFLRVLGVILLTVVLGVFYGMGLWNPELSALDPTVIAGVVFCALITTFGGALADISNNISRTSNLNQFWSFTPFLAVIFLNLFGFSDDTSKELYFGAILILAANFILLSSSAFSMSFIAAIFFLCAVYFLILFVPPLEQTIGLQHVSVSLGIFGIFAALFIDRIMRDQENRGLEIQTKARLARQAATRERSNFQNIFVLWILGFGSIVAMVLFRPEGRIEVDFVSAFVAVAVFYICLLPLEYVSDATEEKGGEEKIAIVSRSASILSLVTSALFIAFLFGLYLIALLS